MTKRTRWILAFSLFALVAGLAWAAYARFTGQITWRVAISEHRSDDAQLFNELGKWMAARNRRSRIEVVMVADENKAVDALRDGSADLASVRADVSLSGGINSMATLYREVAVFVALPKSGIEDWPHLKGKTVALVGHTATQDRLVQKILRARNVSDVKLIEVDRKDIDALLKQNGAHVIAQVAPLISTQHPGLKTGSTLRKVKGVATMLELADAEALASADKRYEGIDIPTGGVRDAPQLPVEETSTLAVARHLIVKGKEQTYPVQRLLIDIMDAKRAIASDVPLARKIGSPGVEKDGVIKIHAGAASYFNGEEVALGDVVLEWFYLVPMIIGGGGAMLAWLYNLMWPESARHAQHSVAELLAMRRELASLSSQHALRAMEERRDQVMSRIDKGLASGKLPDNMIAALVVASDAVDRKIDQARERLGVTRSRSGGSGAEG